MEWPVHGSRWEPLASETATVCPVIFPSLPGLQDHFPYLKCPLMPRKLLPACRDPGPCQFRFVSLTTSLPLEMTLVPPIPCHRILQTVP